MKRNSLMIWCVWSLIICVTFLMWPSDSEAKGRKVDVGGVTLNYSKSGFDAFYDSSDMNLTIDIWEGGGSLSVSCGNSAKYSWGDYCDVYISAIGINIKSMKFKATTSTVLFVSGFVGFVDSFSITRGCVGSAAYGFDFGLYTTIDNCLPKNIRIKDGFSIGEILMPFSLVTDSNSLDILNSANNTFDKKDIEKIVLPVSPVKSSNSLDSLYHTGDDLIKQEVLNYLLQQKK